jgi:hypothetical protein
MDGIESLVTRYNNGGRIVFGPRVALAGGTLYLAGDSLPLNTLEMLSLDDDGNALIRRLGSQGPALFVPAAELEDADRFVRVTNHLIQAIPYFQRRSITGWPPGSIGDVSARIGTDVRELLKVGYSHEQIGGLLRGEYTLDELYEQRPKGRPMGLRRQRS